MTTDKIRALLVQNSPEDVQLIRRVLSLAEFEVEVSCARTMSEGMEFLLREDFDVVLCDHNLPRMNGLAFVAEVRTMESPPAIILLTASADAELVAEAFRSGVHDYICKYKLSAQRLLQAITNAVSRVQESDRWFAEAEVARALSLTDPLTGVYNQQYLSETLRVECSRARRYRRPLSCLMLDLDLRALKERYGQVAGDEAIRSLASDLKGSCRESDIVARFGDEFCIVMPETPYEGASQVADRISGTTQSRYVTVNGGERLELQVSVGLFTATDEGHLDPESIIESATSLLRDAKAQVRQTAVGHSGAAAHE